MKEVTQIITIDAIKCYCIDDTDKEVLKKSDYRMLAAPLKDLLIADDIKVTNVQTFIRNEPFTFSFSDALVALKTGRKVTRKGWNGKNQYIELAHNISYTNSKLTVVNSEHDDIGNKAIAFVGTSGVQMGWLASQADLLANDWMIVEE